MQSTTTHLGDGEILHLVDRDASAWELDVWSRHVLACEECAERLAERRRAAQAVSAALAVIHLPEGFPSAQEAMRAARARKPRASFVGQGAPRPALRAAAAVAILLLPVLLVSPVRAAVVDWLRQGWTQIAGSLGGEETAAPATPAAPAADAPAYAVSFTPAGAELAVTLAARQGAGRLSIGAATGTEASVEVRGGGDETPLVTDAGLRIVNTAASAAVYEIAVPAGVRRVVVRVGAEPAVELSAAQVSAGWSLDFGGPVR